MKLNEIIILENGKLCWFDLNKEESKAAEKTLGCSFETRPRVCIGIMDAELLDCVQFYSEEIESNIDLPLNDAKVILPTIIKEIENLM